MTLQLDCPADALILCGLILDIVGVVAIFWIAPEKHPDPQNSSFFALEGEDAKRRDRWKKLHPMRVQLSRMGVSLIVVGFVLQGLGVAFF